VSLPGRLGAADRTADSPLAKQVENHFTAKPRGRAARDEHPMWPTDLDKAFFTSPVYAGCKSIFRRGISGDEIHRDALFWIPTISADLSKLYYTGQHGVCAPGTAEEIAHYTTLAVRELSKKAARRRR
jgi:hypothetical protein